ncbi:MAG: 3-oxoadipate enol-lactonase [Desulfobacterales bacterium]|nr:3-oxoadipate enol-lactonase [Desulfobacterales bacterium]
MQARLHNITVNYEIDGPEDAPVIACSHCLAGDSCIWDTQVIALREKYRILRFDTRGHGGSSAPEGPYSMEMLANDVVDLFDEIGIRKAHFMGISMGGMIAQTLALKHPECISSLILCDTTCSIPESMHPIWDERIQTVDREGMEAVVDETLNRWLSPDFQAHCPATTEKIREIILDTPVPGFIGCAHAIKNFDLKNRLPKISVPTLIMVGENDAGTPVESARQIHENLRGSELAILPQAYHLSNIEAADDFNKRLMGFLAKL